MLNNYFVIILKFSGKRNRQCHLALVFMIACLSLAKYDYYQTGSYFLYGRIRDAPLHQKNVHPREKNCETH